MKDRNPHLGHSLDPIVAIPRHVFLRHDGMFLNGKQGLPHYLDSIGNNTRLIPSLQILYHTFKLCLKIQIQSLVSPIVRKMPKSMRTPNTLRDQVERSTTAPTTPTTTSVGRRSIRCVPQKSCPSNSAPDASLLIVDAEGIFGVTVWHGTIERMTWPTFAVVPCQRTT
jgi:hypothetical protein